MLQTPCRRKEGKHGWSILSWWTPVLLGPVLLVFAACGGGDSPGADGERPASRRQATETREATPATGQATPPACCGHYRTGGHRRAGGPTQTPGDTGPLRRPAHF